MQFQNNNLTIINGKTSLPLIPNLPPIGQGFCVVDGPPEEKDMTWLDVYDKIIKGVAVHLYNRYGLHQFDPIQALRDDKIMKSVGSLTKLYWKWIDEYCVPDKQLDFQFMKPIFADPVRWRKAMGRIVRLELAEKYQGNEKEYWREYMRMALMCQETRDEIMNDIFIEVL